MDWTAAIEMQRVALKRVVAALVAMAGFASGPHPEVRAEGEPRRTLPRHLHHAVLSLLRPAESAARRLAIALARIAPPVLRPLKAGPTKPGPSGARGTASIFVRDGVGTGIVWKGGAPAPLAHLAPAKKAVPGRLPLPLLDPLPRWSVRRWSRAAAVPRISTTSVVGRPAVAAWRSPLPDDPIDAGRLGLRIDALGRALDDLPGLARRFARWQARRDLPRAAGRSHRFSPLRPGRPPGGRLSRYDPDAWSGRKNIREVDEILAHANALAHHALAPRGPDTS